VAGQAYGFDSDPPDPARPDTLNFSRLELIRQVMLNHNDSNTPVWATAFGWNALPAAWDGRPSPWKSNTEAVQAQRTATALEHARRHWPWLGPMLAIRWDVEGLAEDDPARGFALAKTPQVLQTVLAAASETIATPGHYPADHASGQTSPGWRFAQTYADVPHDEPRTLTIPFAGTRLDLAVNRGLYKGYLWVTVDGQPANALPQNSQDQSYVVLYDPLHSSETVTLAQGLPYGRHTATIAADGGWGQWAISGWSVYGETNSHPPEAIFLLTIAVVIGSGIGVVWAFWPGIKKSEQWVITASQTITAITNKLNDPAQITTIFALALAFYFAPGVISLLLLPILALAILLRPDLGLVLIVFSLSFFQAPKSLLIKSFSPVELGLILTIIGFIFREGLRSYIAHPKRLSLHSMDWAAIALVILAFLATLAAPNFGVSMHEWRLVVAESVIFYFLIRLGRDYGPPTEHTNWRWAWRLVDALVAGATLHAMLALYFFTDQSITAEGVRRALGPVYGSPNNLSLFLDRVWPILLAVALSPGQTISSLRRWLYGIGLGLVSLTLYLTFSKGALLVGLPTAVVVMAVLYALRHPQHRQRIIAVAGGCLALLALALVPLSQTQRFRATLDFSQGSTGFFRLKLWEASLNMLRDHWPLGVGLDNFLYQYRTRYILPEAWEEPNLSHPHNLILDFGTRLGIGGIVWLIWAQIAFWLNAWKLYQKTPAVLVLGLMGSMVIFLVHGLVDNSFFLVDLAFIFFLTTGIVQTLQINPNSI
jgi:O-antigen ligase